MFFSQIEQIKGAQVEKFKVLKWFHVNPEKWGKNSTWWVGNTVNKLSRSLDLEFAKPIFLLLMASRWLWLATLHSYSLSHKVSTPLISTSSTILQQKLKHMAGLMALLNPHYKRKYQSLNLSWKGCLSSIQIVSTLAYKDRS